MRNSTRFYLFSLTLIFNNLNINAQCPTANAGTNRSICSGGTALLGPDSAQADVTYTWSPSTYLSDPNIANPIASPPLTTTYTLTVNAAGCAPSQATTTVTVATDPYMSLAWVQDGFDPTAIGMNNPTGQNDMCGYYSSFLHLTLRANRDQVAWYVDGTQVTNGATVPGFTSTANITNNGQVLNLYDISNDLSNHTFRVGGIGSGCTVLSPTLSFRRIPNIFRNGSGYISANAIGTISLRNTPYTFSLADLASGLINNYGMGTAISWSIPGVTYTVNPFDPRMVSVTVPPMYSPSVDPVSGNHYIPGTITISNSIYSCLNTSYSINFAVPANFPNSSRAGLSTVQPATLNSSSTTDGDLLAFPNPARDIVSIRPGVSLGKEGYVEIFTSAGHRVRVIRAAEIPEQTLLQVNVTDLGSGLYFVAVHGKDKIVRGKFLIAR